MMKFLRLFLYFTAVVVLHPCYAEPLVTETGMLSPEPGFEDRESGARVDTVGVLTETRIQRIKVSVPTNGQAIEEVIVYGKRKGKIWKIPQLKPIKIINDPETGRSGIVIHIGEKQPFLLKFNYHEPEAYEGQKQIPLPKSNAKY